MNNFPDKALYCIAFKKKQIVQITQYSADLQDIPTRNRSRITDTDKKVTDK